MGNKKNKYELKNIYKSSAILAILLIWWIFLIKKWWLEVQNLAIFLIVWWLFVFVLFRILFYNIKTIYTRNSVNKPRKLWKLQTHQMKISWFNRWNGAYNFYIYDWENKYESEYFDWIVKNYDWETSDFLQRMWIIYCPLDIKSTLKQMEQKPGSNFQITWFKAELLNQIWNFLERENDKALWINDDKYEDYDDLDDEYKRNYEETENDEDDEVYIEPTLSNKATKYNIEKFKEIYDDLKDNISSKDTKKPYMKLKNWKILHVWDTIDVYINPNNPSIYQIDTDKLYN